ncbi:MAG TPA: caspase family protein [Pyrinomonadaceae bacterium]|nr:caspase family protein [Pyrinomonadaceae bacterium]
MKRSILAPGLCILISFFALFAEDYLPQALSAAPLFDFGPASSTQEPKPSPSPNEKRGIGVEASASPTPSASSTTPGATLHRPEIVVQAGITSPQTELAFNPNGRFLASMDWGGNSIKLWEVASGRLLRQFEMGVPTMGSSSMSRPFKFSADGSRIVSFAGQRIRQWEVETGREVANTLISIAKDVTVAILSEDASTLASVNTKNSQVQLFDVTSVRTLPVISFGEDQDLAAQNSMALSPDGKTFATITSGHGRSSTSITLSHHLSLWDTGTGKRKQRFTVATSQYRIGSIPTLLEPTVTFSADGLWIAVRTKEQVRFWETISGKEVKSFASPLPADTIADPNLVYFAGKFVISKDKQRLSLVTDENRVSLIDLSAGGSSKKLQGHRGPIVAISFNDDGKLLASSGLDNRIKIWDAANGTEVRSLSGAALPIGDVAFSKDGKSLSMVGAQTVSFWELTTGSMRRGFATDPDNSSSMQTGFIDRGSVLSPDGRLMMSGGDNRPPKLWDVSSGRETLSVALSQGRKVANAAFTNDGKALAVFEVNQKPVGPPAATPQSGAGLPTDTFSLPDTTKLMEQMKKNPKKLEAEMKKVQEAVEKGDLNAGLTMMESLGLMPSANKASRNPNTLRVIEVASGHQLTSLPLSGGFFTEMASDMLSTNSAMAFSPDGRFLASASGYNAPVHLIDVASGQQIHALKIPFSLGVNGLAWTSDGKRLASSQWGLKKGMTDPDAAENFSFEDMSFSIKIWDPETGSELVQLPGHQNFVMRLAFSGDGQVLASGSFDSTIKLWEASTGRELHTLVGHSGAINALSFSPDGKLLISGSDDGTARLWKTKTGELLAALVSLNRGNDWLVVTPSGLFDGSPGGWNQILWRFSPAVSDVSPVEIFFNEYFHPGLLNDIIEGRRLPVATDISRKDRRQPKLTLNVSGVADGRLSSRTAKVSLNISDAPAGARDVRLFRNGTLVKHWRGDVLKGQPQTSLEVDVSFVAGQNDLRAYAFNHDNVKSSDAVGSVVGDASLKRPATLHLIVVGINQYANPGYDLKYAVADGMAFAEEVQKQQRQLGRFAQIDVTTLFDQLATKANLVGALQRLSGANAAQETQSVSSEKSKAAQPEDAVVVYFAGHGTAQNQRFYLIPHDLGYQGKRTELDDAGLRQILDHSISDLELEDLFTSIDAGLTVMVIDACNSGQALEAEEKRRGPMNSKGLAQLAYEKGMYVLTAAQSYQAALEAEQLGHGYLTFALVEEGLKGLKADIEPVDGQVLLREWLNYATDRVPQMQQEKMRSARGLLKDIAFVEGEEVVKEVDKRTLQRPRVFYRREEEAQPIVVARP